MLDAAGTELFFAVVLLLLLLEDMATAALRDTPPPGLIPSVPPSTGLYGIDRACVGWLPGCVSPGSESEPRHLLRHLPMLAVCRGCCMCVCLCVCVFVCVCLFVFV